MRIDSYEFGEIVIDGESYDSDVIILSGKVYPDWWRKQGHLLSADDLEPVIAAKPELLIIGCGVSALMKVPEQTRQLLLQNNIKFEVFDTPKAVQRFNELSQTGLNVAAALHLTC
jgi:hypothetical protein